MKTYDVNPAAKIIGERWTWGPFRYSTVRDMEEKRVVSRHFRCGSLRIVRYPHMEVSMSFQALSTQVRINIMRKLKK